MLYKRCVQAEQCPPLEMRSSSGASGLCCVVDVWLGLKMPIQFYQHQSTAIAAPGHRGSRSLFNRLSGALRLAAFPVVGFSVGFRTGWAARALGLQESSATAVGRGCGTGGAGAVGAAAGCSREGAPHPRGHPPPWHRTPPFRRPCDHPHPPEHPGAVPVHPHPLGRPGAAPSLAPKVLL